MDLKLKICGMKLNIAEVAKLQPDYLGFIFYKKSPRFFEGEIPELHNTIKKVGIFVDATIEEIIQNVKKYHLDVVQLHGDETANFCKQLFFDSAQETSFPNSEQRRRVEVWKVFSIEEEFNFETLKPYENVVDKFLFDTKGKEKGGTGKAFNWTVLKDYPSQKPFVLSGGIGIGEIDAIRKFLKTGLPIHAIDVNSKFEIEPGLKNIEDLKKFKDEL